MCVLVLLVFKEICNSRKNQIIGQQWRRVNNELLQARSPNHLLLGAPDVSSRLGSSLPFYLCCTLANFFYLNAHFSHPQPRPSAMSLNKSEAKNWERTCWQKPSLHSKKCLLLHKCKNTSLSVLNALSDISTPSPEGVCAPMPMIFLKPCSEKRIFPRGQKIIYVGANQVFSRLQYCCFSPWWADVSFLWYIRKKRTMFSPSWCHLRLLFLLYS